MGSCRPSIIVDKCPFIVNLDLQTGLCFSKTISCVRVVLQSAYLVAFWSRKYQTFKRYLEDHKRYDLLPCIRSCCHAYLQHDKPNTSKYLIGAIESISSVRVQTLIVFQLRLRFADCRQCLLGVGLLR